MTDWTPEAIARDMRNALAHSIGLRDGDAMTPTLYLIALSRHDAITRDDMAIAYGRSLSDPNVDWPAVNRAIVQRWSLSALKYIKREAWKP
jgi:hypothetical protein